MMTGTEFVFPCRSLTYQDSFCRITVPRKGEGVAKTLKAVPPLSDKGGCLHADYIDLSYPRIYDYGHRKEQKPPLGQVTVSSLI